MAYCPKCGSEYGAGVTRCADCQEDLVDELEEEIPEVIEGIPCPECGEPVDAEAAYCEHCGALIGDGVSLECFSHVDRPAVAVCVICHAPVCKECRSVTDEKTLCPEHEEVIIMEEWASVMTTFDGVEANGASARLEAESIPATVVPVGEQPYAAMDGIKDNVVPAGWRTGPVRIFVPFKNYVDAVEMLTDTNFLYKYICPVCDYKYSEEGVTKCPQCGAEIGPRE